MYLSKTTLLLVVAIVLLAVSEISSNKPPEEGIFSFVPYLTGAF
jgi:hypothetical protein